MEFEKNQQLVIFDDCGKNFNFVPNLGSFDTHFGGFSNSRKRKN